MQLPPIPLLAFPLGTSGAGMALDIILHLGKGVGLYNPMSTDHCMKGTVPREGYY